MICFIILSKRIMMLAFRNITYYSKVPSQLHEFSLLILLLPDFMLVTPVSIILIRNEITTKSELKVRYYTPDI